MPCEPITRPVPPAFSVPERADPPEGKPSGSLYTETAGAAVCRDVEEGVTLPEAFLCNGIPAKTGESWLAAHPGFAHEIEVARARYLRSLIREVRDATAGSGTRHDWRASLALLERADQAAARADSAKGDAGSITILSPARLIDLQARRRQAATRG